MEPRGKQNEGFYKDDRPAPAGGAPVPTIQWEASEYVHHDKGFLWVIGLLVVAAAALALAVVFKQWVFAGLIALMAVAFGYYGFRKPHVIQYKLTDSQLYIGEKNFPLSTFTSFGILAEGAFYAIRLIPVKRFGPAIVIYFGKEDGEAIVDALGAHLPMLEMKSDPIDSLMRKLRF